MGCDVAQIHPRVENLADITEAWVPERDVAKPERRKTKCLCTFGQRDLIQHAGCVTLESLQGKEQPKA
ncbi:hypothetical protein AW886_02050 [Pseudomonas aeruginosa]|nr:hypothetical protein AW886_02050 [Pseudomonas aeruginosa]